MSAERTDYLLFLRPEPTAGAVMREVVRVIRAAELPSCGLVLNPVAGTSFLPEVGAVKIYNAEDMGLDAEFCAELAAIWAQALEYNRKGEAAQTGEEYREFLRVFGILNDRADRLVHAVMTGGRR